MANKAMYKSNSFFCLFRDDIEYMNKDTTQHFEN